MVPLTLVPVVTAAVSYTYSTLCIGIQRQLSSRSRNGQQHCRTTLGCRCCVCSSLVCELWAITTCIVLEQEFVLQVDCGYVNRYSVTDNSLSISCCSSVGSSRRVLNKNTSSILSGGSTCTCTWVYYICIQYILYYYYYYDDDCYF